LLTVYRRLLKRYILANVSSTRNISINKERLLFVATRLSKSNFKKTKREKSVKLQIFYYKFMFLNQTESAIIIFNSTSKLFAIKKYKRIASNKIKNILLTQYFETVSVIFVIETFQTITEIYIVYKKINVLLRYILTILRNQFVSHKIEIICREINSVALIIFFVDILVLDNLRISLSIQKSASFL